jgi:hypothetical protein
MSSALLIIRAAGELAAAYLTHQAIASDHHTESSGRSIKTTYYANLTMKTVGSKPK